MCHCLYSHFQKEDIHILLLNKTKSDAFNVTPNIFYNPISSYSVLICLQIYCHYSFFVIFKWGRKMVCESHISSKQKKLHCELQWWRKIIHTAVLVVSGVITEQHKSLNARDDVCRSINQFFCLLGPVSNNNFKL